MKIFQHFCNVLVPCYKIVILNFHYLTFHIALCNILFQKLHNKNVKDNIFETPKQTHTLLWGTKKTCFLSIFLQKKVATHLLPYEGG